METLLQNPLRYAKETLASIVKYAFGKGIVSLGVTAATLISGSVTLPVVAGFVAWKTYRLYSHYTGYKDRMIDLYRDDIAKAVGCDPKAVTREHLRMMAFGEPLLSIEPNPIIAEALTRQRGSGLLSFCTAMLSAGATFALLTVGMQDVAGWLSSTFPSLEGKDLLQKASITAISGISGLVLHNGLDTVIGGSLGYFRPTAHDKIALIAHQKSYGVKITPQQVFDVFLATDSNLAKQVSRTFNKGFATFTAAEKLEAMRTIGVEASMQQLADQINNDSLKPGALAFELASSMQKKIRVKQELAYEKSLAPQSARAPEITPTSKFTDRITPRSASGSHVASELARREAAAAQVSSAPAM